MDKNIIIGNIMKIIVLPKILFYRLFFNIKFPVGSIIYGFPKINNGNLIKIGKNFQLGRLCRLNGKISIGNNFFMNEFGTISAGQDKGKVTIGDDVIIGPLFYLISGDHGFKKGEKFNVSNNGNSSKIVVGNNVWIGARVTILKGVVIGDNVVIGAGSVVTKNIPSNYLAFGNPCKLYKKI